MENFKKGQLLYFYLLALGVLILDQVVKLVVHFNMDIGDEFKILGLNWLKIHYTENPGLAFGLKMDWDGFKILLTLFRISASGFIIYYVYYLWQRYVHRGFIWCIALILAGAIGNVIDSTFYGIFLDNTVQGASMRLFHGKVIDMFYFDIWHGKIFGHYFSIWPIFNVADSSIFIGACLILIFQKKLFNKKYDHRLLDES